MLNPPNPLALLDSTLSSLSHATQLHARLLTHGLLSNPRHLAKFVSILALSPNPSHLLPYSHLVLAHAPTTPPTFALNNLIRAHSKTPTAPLHSFRFYRQILFSPSPPDNFTFTFLVRACAAHVPSAGPAVHAAALVRGHASDPHVASGLIRMYAAESSSPDSFRRVYSELRKPDLVCQTAFIAACADCGQIDLARKMFDEMPHRDAVSWNAMIAGYSHVGRSREALDLFSTMQKEGVKITEATMVSVITACGHLGALDQGRWAHVFMQRKKLRLTVILGTALIDMYSKCGCMERAMEVFWEMEERNVYTWSVAMGGLAMNGDGIGCLELFSLMKEKWVEPNGVTFVSLLRGCSVAGLIDQGREYFNLMWVQYGIEPWNEHYGCMVDMYGRAGRLSDAYEFINGMPIKPHVGAWGALLNACRIYKNLELGELAMSKIVELESRNDGAYVLLSNIYADSSNWKGVSSVRESMKDKGVNKEPGCSVIEIGGEVHEFFVGDRSHPRYAEIEAMLAEMGRRLRLAGYEAKTNQVLFDIEEEEKEDALCWHSEKLAIAFGLVALGEGMTIRIVKNLRVCWDCHEVAKLVSKAFSRDIIMRDRNRFHHVQDGMCTCKDYW